MDDSPTRRRIHFIGKVQGVGFRAMTASVARGFSVSGWVRNEPDGAVTCEVQGDAQELELFLLAHELELGHRVKGRQDDRIEPVPGEFDFEIRY